MLLTVSNRLYFKDYTPELLRWAQKELRLTNPEYTRKVRMGLWLGTTPRTIDLFEIHAGKLILPFGCLRDIPKELLQNCKVKGAFTPRNRVDYGNIEIPLYQYQEQAVEQLIKNHYGILQAPAGSGKTRLAMSLIQKLQVRTLWLTHTKELLEQARYTASQFLEVDLIGTITEGKVNIGKGVTFATIQTMCKLDLASYIDEWDCIIVDECHRVAGSPTAVSQFSKVLNALRARHKYGLSATVHRSDGMIKATYSLLGKVVCEVTDKDVADKIMKVGIFPIRTNLRLSESVLNTDGVLNYSKLINYIASDQERNTLILEQLMENKDYSCLILSDRLQQLEDIINSLPSDMRKKAAFINGKATTVKAKKERANAVEEMRSGDKKYLFASYTLAKEGLDIPRLERLFMATPQKDYAVVTQSIGRIARIFEGKSDPICYDFVDRISLMEKYYKKRCSTYNKNECYWVE